MEQPEIISLVPHPRGLSRRSRLMTVFVLGAVLGACAAPLPKEIKATFILPPKSLTAEDASKLRNIQVRKIGVFFKGAQTGGLITKEAVRETVRGLVERHIALSLVERTSAYSIYTKPLTSKKHPGYSQLKDAVLKSGYGIPTFIPKPLNDKPSAYIDVTITVQARKRVGKKNKAFRLITTPYTIIYSKTGVPSSIPDIKRISVLNEILALPYRELRVSVEMNYQLLNAGDGKVLYSQNNAEVTLEKLVNEDNRQALPDPLRMIYQIVYKDALKFARAIAPHSKKRLIPIAETGDGVAVVLLRGAALSEARARLQVVVAGHTKAVAQAEKRRRTRLDEARGEAEKIDLPKDRQTFLKRAAEDVDKEFSKAVGKFSGDYYNLGIIEEADGYYRDAERVYKRADKLKPGTKLYLDGLRRVGLLLKIDDRRAP